MVADIILASPVYFANVTAQIKALIDRAGMTSIVNDGMLKRKVGASVVAARRGGVIHTFNSSNHFFFISQMIVPGSSYWNMGFGRNPGEVGKDNHPLPCEPPKKSRKLHQQQVQLLTPHTL
jgi:multimeric flavodoxin WrbA